MSIIVDVREQKLIPFLSSEPGFLAKQLELGDIIIDCPSHKVIIERKTIPDFNASLKDGRYRNQKLRLLEWKNFPEENVRKDVIYILEEKYSDNKDRAYWGAIINANLRDGIFVIQSDGLVRTSEIALDIRKKIEEGKFTTLEGTREDIHLEGLSKGDYNSPENCYLGQLAIIPGVSKSTAKILAGIFPDMKTFINEIETHLSNEQVLAKKRIEFLSEIDLNGRRLGDKLAEKICYYLTMGGTLYNNWIELREQSKRKKKILDK